MPIWQEGYKGHKGRKALRNGEIIDGIAEAKRNGGSRFTIKQMEKSKKSLQTKLSKLNDQSRKDDVVFFEELGVDRLFVDEADGYKNLYLYTKMRNVGVSLCPQSAQ